MTENEPKPKRRKLKITLGIVGALVLVSALANLGKDRDPEPTASASSSEVAAGAREDEASAELEAADADAEPEDEATEEESDATDSSDFEISHLDLGEEMPGGETTVEFDLSDNLTQGMWATVAESDTCEAIEAGFDAYPDGGRVVVVGSYPMTDKYGNEDDADVIRAAYDADTYEKINMDNCAYVGVWDLRDGGQIHPDLLAKR
ncbi:hypothetical protein ACTXMZ_15415 [Brachybacterium alimentarium]|uniref:hypothetical protein n=1 Tax=Brachybacterium alimentarium TaxID=47845 RepID=UPI003FCF230F